MKTKLLIICLLLTMVNAFGLTSGDRIQVTQTSGVNVRQTAGGTAYANGQANGSLGILTGSPQNSQIGGTGTSYTWWYINFDSGQDGWVATSGFSAIKPAMPTSPSPGSTTSPGAVQASETITLSWITPIGTTFSDIGVLDVASNVLVVNTTTTSSSYTVTLPPGRIYRWNVSAGDSAGESTFTSVLYFQTPSALLPAPTLFGPVDGSTGVSVTPPFSWSVVSGANRYWLTVATNSSALPTDPNAMSCPSCVAAGISGNTGATNYTPPNAFPYNGTNTPLSPNTTYYWEVQAWNSNGTQGNYSSVHSFTTAATQPSTPSNPSPANGAVISVQPMVLDWPDTPNALSYDVYLKVGAGSFNQVGANLTTSQWSPIETYDSTAFSWYVVAKNASGSTQGPTWSYSIGTTTSSSTFQIGARVMAGSGGANVRDAQLDSPASFLQAEGVHGTITGGPTTGTAGGFTGNWWQITWDSEPPNQNGNNGWSAESVIKLVPNGGDIPQPNFSSSHFLSSFYTTANHFWTQGDAPGTSVAGNLWPPAANGNCVWYTYGRMLELGYSSTQLAAIAPPGQGNAYQWAVNATGSAASGLGVTMDTTPTVGSIAELDSGSFSSLGHVAVVESLNSDGTITVSESSYSTSSSSVWNYLWHHRTIAPTWFSHFIHVSTGATLGVNPSNADIASQIQTLAQQFQIPAIVIAAIAQKESNWKQFDSNGNPLTGPTGDIGIMQINVTSPALAFDANRVRTNWVYNMQVGCQILTNKFKIAAVDSASPYDSASDTYPSILENWYYPIAWYNGSGSDAYSYVTTVYSYFKSMPTPAGSYFNSVSTLGDPNTLGSFPANIYTSIPYPSGSLNLATATQPQLISHGMYTLMILAQNGQKIHQWNWTTSTTTDITSQFTAVGGGGGTAPIISNPTLSGKTFTATTTTEIGKRYTLEYKTSYFDPSWTPVQTLGGTGGIITLSDTGAGDMSRIYHLLVQQQP